VEVARKGVSIVVHPGTYREDIDSLYKNLHLIGMNPDHPEGGPGAVIEGTGTGPVVHFRGSDSDSSLTGFIITGGNGGPAAALYCDGASPVISHCLIVGNRTTDPDGAVVLCRDSQAVLSNCTIADNDGGLQGAGLVLLDSNVKVTNSIFWGNSPREIITRGTSQPSIRYCDVQGWWADYGNLHSDPLFAAPGHWANATNPNVVLTPQDAQAVWIAGDYHVKSQAGRWDPLRQAWVRDAANSPCLDSGETTTPVGNEPAPNGGRINMDAYGGTDEASKSPHGNASSQAYHSGDGNSAGRNYGRRLTETEEVCKFRISRDLREESWDGRCRGRIIDPTTKGRGPATWQFPLTSACVLL